MSLLFSNTMWECTDRKCDRTKAGGIINMWRFFCEIELFKSSDHLKIKVAGFFDQVTKSKHYLSFTNF